MTKKKTEAAAKPAAPKKKTTGKSSKKTPAFSGDLPMIDTNFAPQAAAKMLVTRASLQAALPAPAQPQPESGAFKQLKKSLNKPRVSNSLLDTTATTGQKKSNLHPAFNKQTGHNQTFGNFNRAGVPRRTPG